MFLWHLPPSFPPAVAGTVDEKMYQRQLKKGDIAAAMMGAGGGGGAKGGKQAGGKFRRVAGGRTVCTWGALAPRTLSPLSQPLVRL